MPRKKKHVVVYSNVPPPKPTLPPGIVATDLKYPAYDSPDRIVRDAGDQGQLRFYNTVGFGWCIATLNISRGRNGRSERTYAVRCSDGAGVRIGNGPHVTQQVTVYVRQSRMKALEKYIAQYNSGAIKANTTRDRLSSRRAQGSAERAAGNRYWTWDV
jgi:hypothetical protein